MQINVKLFAGLKDIVGGDLEESFEGTEVTVAQLTQQLAAAHPKLEPYLTGLAVAVNEEYILGDSELLHDGDEVALIPPISGGSEGNDTPHYLVTADELDPRALRDLVRSDRSGAVVVFEGVVRNRHEGYDVERIEYEAYDSMAVKQLQAVAEAVLKELPVHDIAVHHRTGNVEIGEASLLVAVSSEHREEAFAAALRVVDRVKESVPVWKKEFTPDGAIWQEGRPARPAE
ncbi:MAG TPA: molybdenum cofactor biosynthesis protein MoaE [Dehalococcoidia bacterium]|nr:molybdenum cofactor biosynthesis protein MoaE [Dehalococcoidia bacterium]